MLILFVDKFKNIVVIVYCVCYIMVCCVVYDVVYIFIKYIKFLNLFVKLWNFWVMIYDIFYVEWFVFIRK